MKRPIIFGLPFALLLLGIPCALASHVLIVDLRYEDGKIEFDDGVVRQGFFPDRKIVIGNYKGSIVDLFGRELYGFGFDVPRREFFDYSNATTGEIHGGVIVYDEVRFALVLPYFSDAKRLVLSYPNGSVANDADLSGFSARQVSIEDEEGEEDLDGPLWNWLYLAFGLFGAGLLFLGIVILRRGHTKTI